MNKKICFLLISIFFLLIMYFFMYHVLNPNLAWLAFPIGLLLLNWFELTIFKPLYLINSMSKKRIELNLKVSGVKYNINYYIKTLKIRAILISILMTVLFSYFLQTEIFSAFEKISQSLSISRAILRLEYPSYLGISPKSYNLNENKINLNLDTASFLEIRIENLKSYDNWNLVLKEKDIKNNDRNSFYSFSLHSGIWSSSVESIYNLFKHKESNLFSKNIEVILTNNNKKFYALININPISKPIVKLNSIGSSEGFESIGKLNFNVDVSSMIPLTLVELALRTESGYHFTKTLAEFLNSVDLNFHSKEAEIITLGIPFISNDTLYVKAIAKTVLSGLVGESDEISFQVKPLQQVRKEILKNLEIAETNLFSESKFSNEIKQNTIVPLSKAAQLAEQMNHSGVIRKNITKSIQFVENISTKNDFFYKKALSSVQSTIKLLMRQQEINEIGNFLARLLNLKHNISKLDTRENSVLSLVSESFELKDIASSLQKLIIKMSKNESIILSKDEKKLIENLLNKDVTPDKIHNTAISLQQKKIEEAQLNIHDAVDEANSHMGLAIQLIQQAWLRTIQQAQNNLQNSSLYLEDSKPLKSKGDITNKLARAKDYLNHVPQIAEEFDRVLKDAKSSTNKTISLVEKNKLMQRFSTTQEAQVSIEKALLLLQDEEEGGKELQREQDARLYRSTMDVLAAQGVLDSSWRKKILDEISKLKSQGESSDSPMIRYLESRLR